MIRWLLIGVFAALGLATGAVAQEGWPSSSAFDDWADQVVAQYADPAIPCDKITAIDSPAPGEIHITADICEATSEAGHSKQVAGKLAAVANRSFRDTFPEFTGRLTITGLSDEQ